MGFGQRPMSIYRSVTVQHRFVKSLLQLCICSKVDSNCRTSAHITQVITCYTDSSFRDNYECTVRVTQLSYFHCFGSTLSLLVGALQDRSNRSGRWCDLVALLSFPSWGSESSHHWSHIHLEPGGFKELLACVSADRKHSRYNFWMYRYIDLDVLCMR